MKQKELEKWWVPVLDSDAYNYFPSLEIIEECIRMDAPIYGHINKLDCQKECDLLNSL